MVENSEGRFTALHNDAVFRNRKIITEVYRTELDRNIRALGYETERGKYDEVNIQGVDERLVQGFAKRGQQNLKSLQERGLPVTPHTSQLAALATRAAKQGAIDRAELRESWRAEALKLGVSERVLAAAITQAEARQAEGLGATPALDPRNDARQAVKMRLHPSERARLRLRARGSDGDRPEIGQGCRAAGDRARGCATGKGQGPDRLRRGKRKSH
ncbi:relaxase domain-containing protein [Palleronia caenipelagi]|uniref:TrwC relaxase domain-containing protein n=1 Tax=Palleronia caenipelagi TaxID=2489174 RepID=A0A547PUH5_9RHOB|nr:relaxase domain-containing protein [Palleronia caenipelagi]TRD17778.1 hypothetical protein FEV53_12460 [Palleronia caenipelagi]